MRIGIIYTKFYPLTSSASAHGYYVFSHLKKRGYELHTLGMGDNLLSVDHSRNIKGVFSFLKSIDVLYIRVTHWKWYEWATLLKLLSFGRIKVIWEINAPIEEALADQQGKPDIKLLTWIKRKNRNRRMLSRFCDGTISVSRILQQYCEKNLLVKKHTYFPNGAEHEVMRREKTADTHPMKDLVADRFVVAWAGVSGSSWQGTNKILEVAERMQQSDPDILFVTFGSHSVYNSKILSNVISFAEIRNDLLPSFLSHAHVGLCIYNDYNWSPIGFYGSSLKLFDYMAMELVVIASNMGQIADIIKDGENGLLTDGSIEDIIRKIRYSKENYASLSNMRGNARRLVETTYNWEKVAEKTADFIEKIAGNHR